MRTFFRANEAHISVADAKQAIRDYSPPGDWVNVFVGINGIEETPDGRIKVERTTESRYGHFLDDSFPQTCAELGVEPRYKWDPTRKGYTGARDDSAYVLLHEDFVKVARRYEVLVGVNQLELLPDTQQPKPTTPVDLEQPSPAANDRGDAQAWEIRKVERYHAYTQPLAAILKAAKAANLPIPRASEVLDAWRQKPPPGIIKVEDRSFTYYTASDEVKECKKKALQQAISNMVIRGNSDGQDD